MHRAMSRPSQPLCLWRGIGLLAALSAAACAAAAPSLEGGFRDPPASAKPQVWYHVMNGNGRRNHPASRNGEGLEVDKLSAAALDAHFDAYIGGICDYLGDLSGNGRPSRGRANGRGVPSP